MVRIGGSVPVTLQDQVSLVHIHKESVEDEDQPGKHKTLHIKQSYSW